MKKVLVEKIIDCSEEDSDEEDSREKNWILLKTTWLQKKLLFNT